MNFKFEILIVLVAAMIAAAGCGRSSSTAATAPARPQPTFGTATIRGKVEFIGTPPPRAEIPNVPCHEGATPLKDETVVVNPDHTLANVFVYLADAPASDGSKRPPALLDQVDCRYVPHIVGVQVGQPLQIRSSDAHTMHNVHLIATKNPSMNFAETQAGAEKSVTFQQPEFIRAKCDVHPWMTAYIGVFQSPFFAATSESGGHFEIAKVPAGRYKLTAWHEQYGSVEKTVEVKDGQTVEINLSFKAP